jgi:outer membrane protein OmpA-like peptidoglycan-associated protein
MASLWHRAHFDFSGMVGLMWYVGGRRFDVAETKIAETDCSEQENRIKELTDELERCRANANNVVETKPCDTIVKFVEGESLSYPFSIFFNKGSYELRDGRDRVNLEEFANAAKANGYKIILRGTCDSATASSAFNMTLAENRCNKVKQELIKLGVPESNITINPVGGVKELNPTEYDRRVLIQLSK